MAEVLITEVVLRDGLQDEDVVVPTEEKVRLARGLVDAGLTALEVGSFVNEHKVPQMADTDTVLRTLAGTPATVHTLVFNERGARRAVAAGARSVRLVVSASDGHSRANAGVDTAAALDRLAGSVSVLADADVAVEACIATAFVCPFDGVTPPERVVGVADRLVRLGVRVLHLADTIGAASPGHVAATLTAVRERHPDVPVGLHLHNTYGMALASAYRALQLGVRRFDAALGGIGGCPFAPGAAGNVATDDLVNLCHQEGFDTGIDGAKLAALRDDVAAAVGHRLDSALASVPAVPAAPRTAAY
ncbi:MAG TPA: hydroxymethylglutaryl-CoA lyase [Pseudonocardiaceae bacterium]|nr:hydroxymethylglutaryl-CoA lyase [Pseudonocardiaceae bacterium]